MLKNLFSYALGKNGKKLLPKIHDNKSINSIIIFCLNPEYHKDWVKNFSKIRGIVTTQNELFNLLKELINLMIFLNTIMDLKTVRIKYHI